MENECLLAPTLTVNSKVTEIRQDTNSEIFNKMADFRTLAVLLILIVAHEKFSVN